MNDGNHPYAGAAIAIATLHGKAGALAPAFAAVGARLVPAEDVDTDALGTFSGEIPRRLPPLDTAIEKARLGMRATGLPLGLATEGSFGPDPVLGFVPLHREIAVLVDDTRGLVIAESLASHETNLAGRTIAAADALDDAELTRWKFPSHALIVRAEPASPDALVRKGLRDRVALDRAIAECLAASPEGRVRVETDMRAHLNPSRMARIAELAERLVHRLGSRCPQCDAPGFGPTGSEPGLPCSDCGAPTAMIRAEIHACTACGAREARPRGDGRTHADPAHCDLCNP
jgi:hypothetical protein